MAPFLRIVAAAAFLAVGPFLAWAQRGSESNWCSKNDGCGSWDTLYAVTIEGDRIKIKYRDTEFTFFEGRIHRPAGVNWTIIGKIPGTGSVTGVARGNALLDIAKIDRLVIDGTLTRNRTAGSAGTTTPFRGTIRRENASNTIKGYASGTLKGHIKGTVKETGESVEGHFEGTVQEDAKEWRISGTYTPPPEKCSFVGNPRNALTLARQRWRLAQLEQVRQRPNVGRWRTDGQKEAKEARLRNDRARSGRLEAEVGEVARDDDPLGKFSRAVKGTMNFAMDEIAIELPDRPVLTDKCTVQDNMPAAKLELVKQ